MLIIQVVNLLIYFLLTMVRNIFVPYAENQ